ncbi:hypothetical protein [Agromyces seonyuensis]|uniref:Uncharacterized protein n=1 Tax=Agromyces seonyuensis TaxID=2662446 RepID=A0A6I4P439_9MICO|nr:hypothetical protein [Agromyces seonyuensis]MWB98054.1 hypothetical protein [Agromyces seonyuensis]
MLDLWYVLGVIALFALVGLVAEGVSKLGPDARGSAPREAGRGGERA